MSTAVDVNYQVISQGNPFVMWVNRTSPFIIGSARVAHSGKVALVRTATISNIGKPMLLRYRLARKAHIDAWSALISNDPFNTTTIVSYLDTGYKVIFSPNNPISEPQNEIIRDYDIDQTIFDSSSGDYRKGFDWWTGTLSLIITGTV
jgi:hypothetical protein